MKHALIGSARGRLPARRGRTPGIDLRRAVSDGYYALFHALAQVCADELVGPARRWTQAWERAYRALEHGGARKALQTAARTGDPPVVAFASIFAAMQELRHKADYDPRPLGMKRLDVVRLIDEAERAIDGLDAMDSVWRQKLAAEIVFKARP